MLFIVWPRNFNHNHQPLSFNPLGVHTETKLTTAQQLFALTRLILLLLPVCNIRCCYYIWLSPVHGPRQQLQTLPWQSSLLCFSLFNFLILFSFLSVTLFLLFYIVFCFYLPVRILRIVLLTSHVQKVWCGKKYGR